MQSSPAESVLHTIFPASFPDVLKDLSVHQAVNKPIVALASTLDKAMYDQLPVDIKMALAGAIKGLEKLTPEQRADAAAVSDSLRQNPLLESRDDSEVSTSTKLAKDSNAFEFKQIRKDPIIKSFLDSVAGGQYSQVIKQFQDQYASVSKTIKLDQLKNTQTYDKTITPEEVRTWLQQVIKNDQCGIVQGFNSAFFADIIVYLTTNFSCFQTADGETKPILQLVIFNMPTLEKNSSFELISLQISGWSDSKHAPWATSKQAGLVGKYSCRKFQPRESVIAEVDPQLKERAVAGLSRLLFAS